MKSSCQLCLEGIEQTLQHAGGFQLHAARHKVLVIRDALAEDKAHCDAMLLKIDHLIGEAFVAPVGGSALCAVASPVSPEPVLNAA